MWYVYIPKFKEYVEADNITMDFRVNAVSSAQIVFSEFLTLYSWSWLNNLFSIGDSIQIKYDDMTVFNGYVQQINSIKTQAGYQLTIMLYDPLGKLTKMTYKGGFSGRLCDLIEQEICPFINIKNRINSDTLINLHYENEVTRYSLLVDACALARYQTNPTNFGFYYNHQLNALCTLDDTEGHIPLQSLSNTNRISINQTYGYIVANVIQVTNTRE